MLRIYYLYINHQQSKMVNKYITAHHKLGVEYRWGAHECFVVGQSTMLPIYYLYINHQRSKEFNTYVTAYHELGVEYRGGAHERLLVGQTNHAPAILPIH